MAENSVGFNIELGLDSSQLRDGLKQVKDDLKADKAELSEIDKQLKIAPDNIDKWKKKQQLLNKQIEDTKKKLKLQVAQLKQAEKEFDNTDEAKARMKKLGEEIKKTNNELKAMTAKLETVNTKMKTLTSLNIDKLAGMGNSLSRYITAPAIAAATALGTLAVKTVNSTHDLADQARQVNADVQAYQELIYATQILGGKSESLQRAFIKVNSMLGDIATGDSLEVAQNLHKIGLSVDDIAGKDTTEAFMIIREALGKLGDESLAVAYANELFGERIGANLLPLLKAEDETIQSLINEANSLGIATDEQVELSDKFAAENVKLKQALYGVALQLADTLIPALTNMVDTITSKVIPKIKDVINWWNNLDDSTKKVIEGVGLFVVALGPLVTSIAKVIKIATALKTGLSALGAATTALGTPIGAIVVGLTAFAGAMIYAYNTDEDFKESINNIGKALIPLGEQLLNLGKILLESLMPILETVIDIIKKVITALTPLIDNVLKVINSLLTSLMPIITKLFEIINPIITFITDKVSTVLINVINIITKLANIISTVMVKAISLITDRLKPLFEFFEKIWQKIKDIIDTIKSIGSNTFGKIGNWFGDIFSGLKGTISGWFGNSSTTNNRTNNNTVNVYTTASSYDTNLINEALGLGYGGV